MPAATPLTRYVANTGGSGVSLRSSCRTEDRTGGAFAEGTRGEVIEQGTGACEGWSVLAVGDSASWVRDVYLSASRPACASPPTAAKTPTPPPIMATAPPSFRPPPTATPTPTAIADGEFVLDEYEFGFAPGGIPQVTLIARNISDAKILVWHVEICVFDRWGDPVLRQGWLSHCINTSSEVQLGPGHLTLQSWLRRGQDEAYSVTVRPTGSDILGGPSWVAPS